MRLARQNLEHPFSAWRMVVGLGLGSLSADMVDSELPLLVPLIAASQGLAAALFVSVLVRRNPSRLTSAGQKE